MRVVIQRVRSAAVEVAGEVKGEIGRGLLLFLGIATGDTREDVDWLAAKISKLRIFNDVSGSMNKSLREVGGGCLVVSQFTLHASIKKGCRPSYSRAAPHERARAMYEAFIQVLSQGLGQPLQTGEFGADMQVQLVNDGPVTLIIDTKNKE